MDNSQLSIEASDLCAYSPRHISNKTSTPRKGSSCCACMMVREYRRLAKNTNHCFGIYYIKDYLFLRHCFRVISPVIVLGITVALVVKTRAHLGGTIADAQTLSFRSDSGVGAGLPHRVTVGWTTDLPTSRFFPDCAARLPEETMETFARSTESFHNQ